MSLTAVEQGLDAEWSSSLHCVVSVPDEKKGERLILVTTFKEATRELVLGVLRAKGLPEIAAPREVRVVKSLPLLGSGKIDVQQVQKLVV